MIITRLEEMNKSKVRVYIDHEYAFWLYEKDIAYYRLTESTEISEVLYHEIIDKTVLHRAKLKALALLKFSDRTELELRNKLKEAGYKEEVIDRTIDYINGYGYLNEERLASSYVRNRMNSKSKLMIKMELQQKGVSSKVIEEVFREEFENGENEDAELNAIRKVIARKVKSTENLDYETKQKLMASLYRKGFDPEKIKRVLE